MYKIKKYTNIETAFPKLPKVLQESIQHDILEIRMLDCGCGKYEHACGVYAGLKEATHVIYSPYIQQSEHRYETFVFIDAAGRIVCHISGNEMELYGLLKPCTNLSLSAAYANRHLDERGSECVG